jgi:hypothetical protein
MIEFGTVRHHVRPWPKTDLRSVLSDIRCWRKSGSSSGSRAKSPFDPNATISLLSVHLACDKIVVWNERPATRRREFITLAGAVASLWLPLQTLSFQLPISEFYDRKPSRARSS